MAGGRRGPAPKPTAIRLVRGNPGKHQITGREPRPKAGVPRAPEWLPDDARPIWRRLSDQLKDMGVLTLAESDAMAGYCTTFLQWRRASEFLDKHGMTYPLRDGGGRVKCLVAFPEVAIARNALLLLKAYQQEFGMTPAARTRIQLERADAPQDEATEIIGY